MDVLSLAWTWTTGRLTKRKTRQDPTISDGFNLHSVRPPVAHGQGITGLSFHGPHHGSGSSLPQGGWAEIDFPSPILTCPAPYPLSPSLPLLVLGKARLFSHLVRKRPWRHCRVHSSLLISCDLRMAQRLSEFVSRANITREQSSGAVWKSRWPSWAPHCIVQELCESRGGRPGLSVLTNLLVSVDVKNYWTMLRHWSQLVPNMSTDIWGH